MVAFATVVSILVVAPAALGASTAAKGSLRVALTSDATTIGPLTRAVNAEVVITTGSKPARVALTFTSRHLTRYVGGKSVREGLALRYMGMGNIKGLTGYIGSGGGSKTPDFSCGEVFGDVSHGVPDEYESTELEIRRNHTVSFLLKYEISGDAPWLGTSYAPVLRIGPFSRFARAESERRDRGDFSEFSKPVSLTTPAPLVALPLAGRVDFDLKPRPKRNFWGFSGVRGGSTLQLSGALVPARANFPINLWADGKLLASLHTDGDGRFSYPWRVPAVGDRTIRAEFPGGPGTDLAPDRGCTATVEVTSKSKSPS